MNKKITYRVIILLIIFCIFLNTSNLTARSYQATIPINITVNGKLIITDAENDNKAGTDPTLNVVLKLTPELDNQTISGKSSVRIRTNLNNWKLSAQRINPGNLNSNIKPEDVQLSFSTQNGSKANSNAGKLISPFDGLTTLGQISSNKSTDILIGQSKTSVDKDPGNKNNWFQLTSSYSITPDFLFEIGEWNTTVTYNLVSP